MSLHVKLSSVGLLYLERGSYSPQLLWINLSQPVILLVHLFGCGIDTLSGLVTVITWQPGNGAFFRHTVITLLTITSGVSLGNQPENYLSISELVYMPTLALGETIDVSSKCKLVFLALVLWLILWHMNKQNIDGRTQLIILPCLLLCMQGKICLSQT